VSGQKCNNNKTKILSIYNAMGKDLEYLLIAKTEESQFSRSLAD
jgi:hypothetical protein